jgi:hypothetical protein
MFPAGNAWTKDAQPHWHVLEQEFWRKKHDAQRRALEGLQLERHDIEIREFGPQIGIGRPNALFQRGGLVPRASPIDRFHFAMAADWHTAGDHRVMTLTEGGFIHWLGLCLDYIRGQLRLG